MENSKLKELVYLNIGLNEISNIRILEKVNFIKLESLELSYINLVDIKNVKFEKLKKLYLDHNKI